MIGADHSATEPRPGHTTSGADLVTFLKLASGAIIPLLRIDRHSPNRQVCSYQGMSAITRAHRLDHATRRELAVRKTTRQIAKVLCSYLPPKGARRLSSA
jgi:hypothetical protein